MDYVAKLDPKSEQIAPYLEARETDITLKENKPAMRELEGAEQEKTPVEMSSKAKVIAEEAEWLRLMNEEECKRLEEVAAQLSVERKAIERKKLELIGREQAVAQAEHTRDAGFADERAALNLELRDQRMRKEADVEQVREEKYSALESEISALRARRLGEVLQAEQAERERVRQDIAREREAWMKQQDDTRKLMEAERTEFERQKGALSALQGAVEGRQAALEAEERLLERKEQRLEQRWQKRYDELDDEVDARFDEARQSLEVQKQSMAEENGRLRESLRIQTGLFSAFEQLKRQLGGKDPAEIIRDLNSQTDELKRLREELATRPTEEMRERYQLLEAQANEQQARAQKFQQKLMASEGALAEVSELRRENSEFQAEVKSLAQKASIFEGAANEAQTQLDRLRAAYERPTEVAARYKEIEIPHIKADKVKPPVRADIDEMTWLRGVGNACDNYGLHFNPRILKAFHTALKTAEWSPLTVLAGVSGTGKSELPRLYSHFGGIYFEPLSVQPNWDSQESMLGFFNSIDNKFDAQPVLRFLAQSQKDWMAPGEDTEGYPGLSDALCLVLLDEMNLAHPELYFAEFLSKLELRRGRKASDVPFLPVKIGAGMKPYELSLGRNVLWAGTMNQDETTKSLSDKVVDRSIIIHFPRPTELKRRLKLIPLDDKNRGPALHKTSWQNWLAKDSKFSEQDIEPFKQFIEKMNAALEVVGRAIGHRVWQSVEYYMANYPDVQAAQITGDKDALAKAMHVAFEDQLVQKVMPKLRGIDTRGKSKTECLDKIRGQINTGIGNRRFNLEKDFDIACELGYGQFIWQSANYLNAADTVGATAKDMKDNAEFNIIDTDGYEVPPVQFQKNITDQDKRHKAWNLKSLQERSRLRAQLDENLRTGKIPTSST